MNSRRSPTACRRPNSTNFPTRRWPAAFDGETSLTTAASLGRRVEELGAEREQLKSEREALDRLSRYRHKMLRSRWVRLGLMLNSCHALVSNRGKKPLEKLLWLRDTCSTNIWLRIGEKLGSQGCLRPPARAGVSWISRSDAG